MLHESLDPYLHPSGKFSGRIDVFEGPTGRRSWPDAVKGRIVLESLEPGAVVCEVARRHGVRPQQLSGWRRLARLGKLALPAEPGEPGFAALLVCEESEASSEVEPPSSSGGMIEIEVGEVVVRLCALTPASRIGEIVAALGGGR